MSAPTEQQASGTPFNVGYPIYQPPASVPAEPLWASAAPLGFAAFAMITLMLWLQFWGALPRENAPIIFPICLAGGIAQIVSGMIELRRGVGVRGNLLAAMGCLFMLAPGFSFLMVALKLGTPVPILGYLNMMLGMFMGIWGLAFLRAPVFVFVHIAPWFRNPVLYRTRGDRLPRVQGAGRMDQLHGHGVGALYAGPRPWRTRAYSPVGRKTADAGKNVIVRPVNRRRTECRQNPP